MSENKLNSDQFDKLSDIFKVLFNRPDLELNDNLTAKDVPGGVRFSNDEVGGMQNVGNLKKLLATKII